MANPRRLLPDEAAPEAHLTRQIFYESGPAIGKVAEGSTKVGWTVRNSRNQPVDAFSFLINPQGIGRSPTTRTTLAAVKGGFFVDDFGPGPTTITLRQLVASGRTFDEGQGAFYTAREDVQRFIKTIWEPATKGPLRGRRRVYFHDHHLERGFDERVFFPSNGLTITRDVQLQNIWQVEIQMVSLERLPYTEVSADTARPPAGRQGRQYVVKHGDTLHKIARRVAGAKATEKQVKKVLSRIVDLNPFLKKKRAKPGGGTAKPMRVYPGEILRLPTS